jgi:DNA-binding transcriptional ArsR family regulator
MRQWPIDAGARPRGVDDRVTNRVWGVSHDVDTLAKGLDGFSNPLRIRLVLLLESESSPTGLHTLLNGLASLGTVSYHVRELRKSALIEETRIEPRRGALEHFYRRTALGDELAATVSGLLGIPARGPRRPGLPRQREVLQHLGVLE